MGKFLMPFGDHPPFPGATLATTPKADSPPAAAAARYNAGKPDMALLPWDVVDALHPERFGRTTRRPDLSFHAWFEGRGDVAALGRVAREVFAAHRELFGDEGTKGLDTIADWAVPVLAYGAAKYASVPGGGRDNWRKGFPLTSTFNSGMRHLVGYHDAGADVRRPGMLEGSRDDHESGLFNASHWACNALFGATYLHERREALDDRPTYRGTPS